MYKDMPLGFVNALAKNESAMQKFAQMEKSEKEIVLEKAHNVSSKQEMQNLINSIGSYLKTVFRPPFFFKIIYKFELLSKRFRKSFKALVSILLTYEREIFSFCAIFFCVSGSLPSSP